MKTRINRPGGSATQRNRQRGVGLIEVLIAVLVLAVGMISLASMQLAAKRASYEATQRSIATSLARDIVERMRSNPDQLDAFVVSNIGDEASLLATPAKNCSSVVCTPAELATHDLAEWESLLVGSSEKLGSNNAGGLVAPRACITHAAGVVTVAIAWRGVASLTNPGDSTCGESVVGLYDDPDEAAGNNLKRRLLFVSTFIEGL